VCLHDANDAETTAGARKQPAQASRRLDASSSGRDARAIAWSGPVAMTSRGRRDKPDIRDGFDDTDAVMCVLATCASDGGVETYAPTPSRAERRERVFDVGEDWRLRCTRDAFARVGDAVVHFDAAPRARRCANALEWIDRDDTPAVKMESRPPPMSAAEDEDARRASSTTITATMVYGTLARGVMLEVSSSTDASASWRVATVMSTASNACVRARVEFARGGDGDYVAWLPEPSSTLMPTAGTNSENTGAALTIPCQSRVVARGSAAKRVECRARPIAPMDAFAATHDNVKVGDFIEVLYKHAWRLSKVMNTGGKNKVCVQLTADGNVQASVTLSECRLRAKWGGAARGWSRLLNDKVSLPETLSEADDDVDELMPDAIEERVARTDDQVEPATETVALEAMFPSSGKPKTHAIKSVARKRKQSKQHDTKREHMRVTFDDAPFKRQDMLSFTSCAWARARAGESDVHILSCGTRSGHVVSYVMHDDLTMSLLHVMRVSSSAHVTSVAWHVGAEDASLFIGATDGSIFRSTSSSAHILKCARALKRSTKSSATSNLDVDDIFTAYGQVADADNVPVTCMDTTEDSERVVLVAGKANGDVFMATFSSSGESAWIKRVSVYAINGVCFTRAGTHNRSVACAYVVCARACGALDVPCRPNDAIPVRAFERTAEHNTSFATATVRSIGAAASPKGTVVARFDAFTSLHKLPNLEGFKEAKFWRARVDTRSFIA